MSTTFGVKQMHTFAKQSQYYEEARKYKHPAKKANLKSLFSDKPDPSCHADRVKARGWKSAKDVMDIKLREEKQLAEVLRKKNRLEAYELQEMAREAAEKVFKVIQEVAMNEEAPPAVRLQAANMVLDRAYGRAATTNFNVNADIDTKLENLDDDSIRRRIAQNLARLEARSDNDRKTIEGEARPINLREYN